MTGLHIDGAFHGLEGLAVLFGVAVALILAVLAALVVLGARARQRQTLLGRPAGWGFAFQWSVATSFAFVAASAIPLDILPATRLGDALSSGLALGGMLGFLQRLVLRNPLMAGGGWIGVTVMGFLLASIVSLRSEAPSLSSLLGNADLSAKGFVWPLLTGTVVGGSQ